MDNYQNKTDEDLAEIVRSENKEAYREIVGRYEDKLMRYANYLIGDGQKVMDVVQETFIKAYTNLNGFDAKKKFSSWIFRIAHNEAMNAVKKYRKEIRIGPEFDVPDDRIIEEEYGKKEAVVMAHKCLGKIPLIYSEPLALYYLDDKSYEEISDILRIPVSTIGTRIRRAKVIMKSICQK